jgi:hypothetical protein
VLLSGCGPFLDGLLAPTPQQRVAQELMREVDAGIISQEDAVWLWSSLYGAAPTAGTAGTPVYSAGECIGPVIMGVCHGSVIDTTPARPRCYGTMLNGQCTGPMF